MTTVRTILAATDFSVDGNNAVRRAALLAQQHGSRLHILHVLKPAVRAPLRSWFAPSVDIEIEASQARLALRRTAIEIAGACDVNATVEVRVGDVPSTLLEATAHADLLVLGQHGRGGLETLLVGSTVERMVRTSKCPVLVVKQAAATAYRQVLLPVDFSPSSDAAVQATARWLPGAFVHVFQTTDSQRESMLRRSDVDEAVIRRLRASEEAGSLARMRRMADRLGLRSSRAAFSVARSPAEVATLQRARALGTDLIVAGEREPSLGGLLLGSVASGLLAAVRCDMLIVSASREDVRTQAGSTSMPRAGSEAAMDGAVTARAGTAALAPSASHVPWTRNRPRFLPRRA